MGAIRRADTALYREIGLAYEDAKAKGMYKGQYAINTVAEYWAEGTQWWFWSNIEFYDGSTRIQTPEDLLAYDPRSIISWKGSISAITTPPTLLRP